MSIGWNYEGNITPVPSDISRFPGGTVATGAAWLKGRNSQGGREEQKHPYKKKNTLDSYRPSHGRTKGPQTALREAKDKKDQDDVLGESSFFTSYQTAFREAP